MTREFSFLIIDDNPHDIEKLERAFRSLNICNPIYRAGNGLEALDMLRGENGHEKIPRPQVVLLDMNMPSMSGIQFLKELRADPELESIMVYAMTTSDDNKDVEEAYKSHVAGYIVKPLNRQQALDMVLALNTYWKLCRFPDSWTD